MDSGNRKGTNETQAALSPGPEAALDRVSVAAEWPASAILRVIEAAGRPISKREIARTLRLGRATISPALAALMAASHIRRLGRRGYVPEPIRPRCMALSTETGSRCGRLALVGSPYCDVHQNVAPTFRWTWTIPEARQYVQPLGLLLSALEVDPDVLDRSLRYLEDLVIPDWPLADGSIGPLRTPIVHLQLGEDARRFLEFHDPQWLDRFDRGEVERPPLRPGDLQMETIPQKSADAFEHGSRGFDRDE